MDLVSSTLDRYLRHRFNGTTPLTPSTKTSDSSEPPGAPHDSSTSIDDTRQENGPIDGTTSDENGQEPKSIICEMNDTTSDTCVPIEIHTLTFQKLVPCCVSLRKDLSLIAAGFENSQIYLWTVIHDESDDRPENNQQHLQNQVSPSSGLTQESSEGSEEASLNAANSNQKKGGLRLGHMSRLVAHSGSVYSIEFVQENDLMLSCSEDTTIRLWCLKSKCNLIVYRGHNYPIWSITISPHGDYFASASMDTTARMWSFDKICPLRIFCGHDDDVECIKFHPNAKYIATGSSDSTVRLWTTSDGRMVRLMVGHKSSITSLSFFPDGKFLASSSSDGSIKVWNLATNSITKDLMVPASCAIAYSPNQEFASTCGRDNILRIRPLEGPSIVQQQTYNFSNKFTKITQAHFVKDDGLFVVGFAQQATPEQAATEEPMIH